MDRGELLWSRCQVLIHNMLQLNIYTIECSLSIFEVGIDSVLLLNILILVSASANDRFVPISIWKRYISIKTSILKRHCNTERTHGKCDNMIRKAEAQEKNFAT